MIRAPSAIGRVYGWKPSLPIFNDQHFALERAVPLPRHVELNDQFPEPWDQGRQGSCTAHGNGAAWCAARKKQGLPFVMPSRSFIYYNERKKEGTVGYDSGATISDGIAVMTQYGVSPESLCPYDPNHLMTTKPSQAVYDAAEKSQVIDSGYINQDLYSIQQALAQKWVIVFGWTVYQNFESEEVARTGLMSMPEGMALGGHCVVACGYNSHNYIMCRNSWGRWGDPNFPGYFWMPPSYATNKQLASDFRIIKLVEA